MSCLNVTVNLASTSPKLAVRLDSYKIKVLSSLVCDIAIGGWEYFYTSDEERLLCSDGSIFRVKRND